MPRDISAQILQEIQDIKKLIILILVKNGCDSRDIGNVLGVSDARIRQLVPMRKLKPRKKH